MKEDEVEVNEKSMLNDKIMLDKSQYRIFAGLAMQRDELQRLFQELVTAEKQHIAMLVRQYGLDEGEYTVKQEGNDVYLMKSDSKSS